MDIFRKQTQPEYGHQFVVRYPGLVRSFAAKHKTQTTKTKYGITKNPNERKLLTRLALKIPSSAVLIVDQFRNVATGTDSWLVHSHFADQLASQFLEIVVVAPIGGVQEFRGWTVFDAHLRRLASLQRYFRIDAFLQVEKQQVRFVHDFTVNTAFPAIRIGWNQQSIQITVIPRYQTKKTVSKSVTLTASFQLTVLTDKAPTPQKHSKNQQAKQIGAGSLRQWPFEIRIEFSCLAWNCKQIRCLLKIRHTFFWAINWLNNVILIGNSSNSTFSCVTRSFRFPQQSKHIFNEFLSPEFSFWINNKTRSVRWMFSHFEICLKALHFATSSKWKQQTIALEGKQMRYWRTRRDKMLSMWLKNVVEIVMSFFGKFWQNPRGNWRQVFQRLRLWKWDRKYQTENSHPKLPELPHRRRHWTQKN